MLENIIKKYNDWKRNNRIKSETLLNAESAYAISAISKDVSFDNIYERYKKQVINEIKSESRFGNTEAYIIHPIWALLDHKAKLYNELKELGYDVLYQSEVSMIISWKKK